MSAFSASKEILGGPWVRWDLTRLPAPADHAQLELGETFRFLFEQRSLEPHAGSGWSGGRWVPAGLGKRLCRVWAVGQGFVVPVLGQKPPGPQIFP